jgi:hypothetical protein
VNKAENASDACKVYRRTPNGRGWEYVRDEKHPVNRNGIFEFEPRKYYDSVGLGAIQKDNQNTVSVA